MSINAFGERLAIREDLNGPAWHNLGGFNGEQTACETMDKFVDGIPTFEKQETYVLQDGVYVPTEDYVIVRSATKDDPKTRFIGNCTSIYNIVQPYDIGNAFDEKVNRPIETLGFLAGGKKMFISWELPRCQVEVRRDDFVNLYGSILAGFDAKVSIALGILVFRPVCENTFDMAVRELKNGEQSVDGGKGRAWVGHHTSKNILRDLRAWMGYVETNAERQVAMMESWFNRLVSTPVDSKNVLRSLIDQIYPMPNEVPQYYPDELRGEKQEKVDALIEKTATDRTEIEKLFFGGDKTTLGENAWDLFNNVTYYENHVRESKKDKNYSIVFGNRSRQMNDALSILVDYSLQK